MIAVKPSCLSSQVFVKLFLHKINVRIQLNLLFYGRDQVSYTVGRSAKNFSLTLYLRALNWRYPDFILMFYQCLVFIIIGQYLHFKYRLRLISMCILNTVYCTLKGFYIGCFTNYYFSNLLNFYSVLQYVQRTIGSRRSFAQSKKASAKSCSVKKVFLEISQNSQESTCVGVSFLMKLQASGLRPPTLLKKRLWHRCF